MNPELVKKLEKMNNRLVKKELKGNKQKKMIKKAVNQGVKVRLLLKKRKNGNNYISFIFKGLDLKVMSTQAWK